LHTGYRTLLKCLTIQFMTAMHLVVLRRNDIDLPEELPPSLQPRTLRAAATAVDSRHNKDLYASGAERRSADDTSHDGGEPLLDGEETGEESDSPLKKTATVAVNSSAAADTSLSPGSMSSPGVKPANFNFHRPDARANPNIRQPVPLRLSPESPIVATSDDEDNAAAAAPVNVKQGRREVVYEQLWNQEDASAEESLSSLTLRDDASRTSQTVISSQAPSTLRQQRDEASGGNQTTDEEDLDEGCSTEVDGLQDLSPSPPPLPRDSAGAAALASLPPYAVATSKASRHLSQQQRSPPHLPPRPGRTHTRSSSLDLNPYQGRVPPPAVPPRCSAASTAAVDAVHAPSALRPDNRIVEERQTIEPLASAELPRNSRSLQLRIHQIKERNSVIARVTNELHQEVSDILEERLALEFHLEQLKSFGD